LKNGGHPLNPQGSWREWNSLFEKYIQDFILENIIMAYETVKLKDKETGKKEPVKFKVGGLHQSLGVPQDKDLPKGIMEKIKKMKVGEKVKVMGKEITITAKIKRQATLGLNLMGKKSK